VALGILVLGLLSLGCETRKETTADTPSVVHSVTEVPPTESAPDFSGQNNSAANPFQFVDVAEEVGVSFTYRNGQEQDHLAILESLGGGVGVFDFDLDGRMDVAIPGGGLLTEDGQIQGLESAFFRHQQGFQFRRINGVSGLNRDDLYTHGVAVGDVDNDGFPDLLFTGYGGLQFYRNSGDGTFSETSAVSGLADSSWAVSAAIADVTLDGAADIYVTHYVDWSFRNHPVCTVGKDGQRDVCPPARFSPLPDTLFQNALDGRFAEQSRALGLKREGKGLGVVIADVNGDQRPDIYVANDTVANFLYINSPSGLLSEVGHQSSSAFNDRGLPDGSMGVAVEDLNNDLRPDIWVTNYEREAIGVYRNEGNTLFLHGSRMMGVTASSGSNVGWGTAIFDVDADGDRDAFIANGHVVRYPAHASVAQLPLLLENQNGRRFQAAMLHANSQYLVSSHNGRGVAKGDMDNDNDIDLIVSHVNAPVAVLRNDTAQVGHWIRFRFIGEGCSRDAVGVSVVAKTDSGSFLGQVVAGGSYASESSRNVFLGLPATADAVDIEVRWPDGRLNEWKQVVVNRRYTVLPGRRPVTTPL